MTGSLPEPPPGTTSPARILVSMRRARDAFESERQFTRAALDAAEDVFFVVDPDGRLLRWNARVPEVTGYTDEELASRPVVDLLDADPDRIAARIAEALETGSARVEAVVETKDGEHVPYEGLAARLTDGEGTPVGVVGIGRDVSERRERERELERTIDRVTAAIARIDADWRFTFVDERAQEVYGMDAGDLLGRTLWDVFPGTRGTWFEEEYRRTMETREPTAFEGYFSELDGWFRVNVYPDDDGGLSFYFDDVTERRESELQFRELTEHIDQAFWMIDADYEEYVYYSPEFEEIWGRTFDDAEDIREAFLETIHPDDRERVREGLDRQLGGDYDVEYRIVRPDGEVRWIRDRASPIENDDGEVYRIAGVSEDVTERKTYEAMLASLHEASRDFARADTDEAVAEATVDAVLDALDIPVVTVFVRDEEGLLQPLAHSGNIEEYGGYLASHSPGGGSITGHVFEDGETAVFEDVHDSEFLFEEFEEGFDLRRQAFVPIGEYGVIAAGDAEVGGFDEQLIELIETLAATAEAALERIERDRDLELFRDLLDRSNDGIAVIEPNTGEFVDANETLCRELGYGREELLDRTVRDITDVVDVDIDWQRYVEESRRQGTTTLTVEYRRPDGTSYPVEASLTHVGFGEDREYVVAVTRDVTERVEYERTLSALHDAARDLQRANWEEEVAALTADAATEVLDLASVAVYLYDGEENLLCPAEHAGDTDAPYDPLPEVAPGDESIIGHVFLDGETAVLADVHDSEYLPEDRADVAARAGLFVPLGDHGVLVAVDTEAGAFDDRTVELAELLAATAGAALDRIVQEADLMEREDELRKQADRIERFDRVYEKLGAIHDAALGEDTRSGIERSVCERLAAIEGFSFVWVGEVDPASGELVPTARAGEEDGYLDAIEFDVESGADPASTAARTREVTVVPNAGDRMRGESWRREAIARGVRSIIALPLSYEGVLYGVLSIHSPRPDAFDALSREVLADGAETVAYAMNAAERTRALLSEMGIELEFEVRDPDWVLLDLARRAGCPLSFQGIVPGEDGETLFATAVDADPDRVLSGLRESPAVANARPVERDEGGCVIELRLRRSSLGSALAEHGFVLSEASADGDAARVAVLVPTTAEVRAAVEAMESVLPGPELIAKRERATEGSPDGTGPLSRLTPRQREVVGTAYHAGFFDEPRRSTGGEIAEALGITPPTFHHHLRAAQRKLLGAAVEGLPDSN